MSSSAVRGALAGTVAGLAGSAVMVGFNHLLGATGFGEDDRGGRHQHRRDDAKPNDTDGTISDEPASIKLARAVGERITGAPLTERQKRIGGSLVHHAFGAFTGAMYGALATKLPAVSAGAGLPYGFLVWLVADEAALPLFGLAKAPPNYRAERHAAALATHLAFGLTVEGVRRRLAPAP
jgi:putative membrane protein